MRYPDCQYGEGGNCAACSLSSYGKDCHNNPVNHIAYLRKMAGMTQQQLADAAHINICMLQFYEYGKRKISNATLKTCIGLADALGIKDLRELLPPWGDD